MTRTVRTTNQPDKDIEVDEREFLELQRQGLLVDDGKSGDSKAKKNSGSGGSGSGSDDKSGS
ncbi:hypothetical protein AB0425_17550 [Actinosynnema sp. NPDC051121]